MYNSYLVITGKREYTDILEEEEGAGFIFNPTKPYYPMADDAYDILIDYLSDKKINTSVHYKPLYLHNILRHMNQRDYPVADVEWKVPRSDDPNHASWRPVKVAGTVFEQVKRNRFRVQDTLGFFGVDA